MALNIHCAMAGLPVGPLFEALESVERHAVAARLYARLLAQLAEAGRDADSYERQQLYRGILCLRVGHFRRAMLLARLACAQEAERQPIASPKNAALPGHDRRPLSELLDDAQPGCYFDWNYPAEEVTYGLVVKASTADSRIRDMATALRQTPVDRLVLASVAPHDVRQRPDWTGLRQSLLGFPCLYEVRLVREAELQHVREWIVLVTP